MSPIFFHTRNLCRKNFSRTKIKLLFTKHKFDSSLIHGAAKICRRGGIQVLTCNPVSRKMQPFPTSFWLTCPFLIKRASKIESQGGVKELEIYMKNSGVKNKYSEYNIFHQVIRIKLMGKIKCESMRRFKNKIFRNLIRGGIGGIMRNNTNDFLTVKCLHLQVASFLALGTHPASDWLEKHKLNAECPADYDCVFIK